MIKIVYISIISLSYILVNNVQRTLFDLNNAYVENYYTLVSLKSLSLRPLDCDIKNVLVIRSRRP